MQGYIKLHRSILDNQIFKSKPYSKGQAWITLLLLTNHKENLMPVKNGQMLKIKRGECGYSELALADTFGWSRGKVKRFLMLLESEKMIQQKIVANHSVIKIINYSQYQDDTTNSTTNGQQTVQQTVQQTDTNKNDKNEKNDKNIYSFSEKKQKADPYINSLNSYFCEEYQKVFGKQKVFLSNQGRNRLCELASDYTNIREIIPEAIRRLKAIEFKDIDFTPSASWLLRADNFERVMNGEFAPKEKEKTWRELLAEKAAKRGIDINAECT